MSEKINGVYFPYEKVREIQSEMMDEVVKVIKNKSHLITHAPTGLGKTAAVLGPALTYALKNEKTVFFLTSRHTQHKIAIETLKEIKKKYSLKFTAIDLIGKKWMCAVPGTDNLYSNEFSEYCKAMRKDGKCEFYSNVRTKGKLSVVAKKIMAELTTLSPMHYSDLIEMCAKEKLCPYEMSMLLINKASVVIADYNYIFNNNIRETFLLKTSKLLENAVVIVDEGHNLPNRIREMMTARISNFGLKRAIKEAGKLGYGETKEHLSNILEILLELSQKLSESNEMLLKKEDFTSRISKIIDYEQLAGDLEFIGDEIREKQKKSSVGGVAQFLESWKGDDFGFSRILSKKEGLKGEFITLSYRCLDPSIATKDIIENSHSTIMMSGTLTPTSMYKDLLGFGENSVEKEFKSPFPEENKLCLVIPTTTTKFTKRGEQEFKKIAKITADIINNVPGNIAVFFPSYSLRDQINAFIQPVCKKTTFLEDARLSTNERNELLEKFKEYKDHGAVLMGVASGSFGEGIDLPGDLLNSVLVVGLPLGPPNLEIKQLINYYDEKFSKGWDYGYILPAITKTLQNAGRCIRSETDRGAVIFLEERYSWPNYFRCFPSEWNVKMSVLYNKYIKEFFSK